MADTGKTFKVQTEQADARHDHEADNAEQQPKPSPAPDRGDDNFAPAPPQKARDLMNLTLDFLSNASNETLGACAVGLCATTYFVLGRVGLVLIGAVGGIALHATWEGSITNAQDGSQVQSDRKRRKEAGVEIIQRTLDWRDTQKAPINLDEHNEERARDLQSSEELEYSNFQPATRSALLSLTDAVIRDYVKYVQTKNHLSSLMQRTGGGIVRFSQTSPNSLYRAAGP